MVGQSFLDLVADTHVCSETGLEKIEADVDYTALSVTMQQLDEKERTVLERLHGPRRRRLFNAG